MEVRPINLREPVVSIRLDGGEFRRMDDAVVTTMWLSGNYLCVTSTW